MAAGLQVLLLAPEGELEKLAADVGVTLGGAGVQQMKLTAGGEWQ
jgi:hypothetical protein